MRPETLTGLFVCIFLAVMAVVCGIIAKLDLTQYSRLFGVLSSLGVLVSVAFGIRYYLRIKPFEMEIRKDSWVVEHLNSHRGVYVRIPKSEHGKGKYPKVEILRGVGVYGSDDLEYEIKEGLVEILHPRSSLTPPAFKECKVVIRA